MKNPMECSAVEDLPPLPEMLAAYRDEILRGLKPAWIIPNGCGKSHKQDTGIPDETPFPTSHLDCLFQINLERLPEFVNVPGMPRQGMVFITYENACGDPEIDAVYHPGPASAIQYPPCMETGGKKAKHPCGDHRIQVLWTPSLLIEFPEYMDYLEEAYNDWIRQAFPYLAGDFWQVGGNMTSCQTFDESDQSRFVAQSTHLDWLMDMGEITLYYSDDRGFHIVVHTH